MRALTERQYLRREKILATARDLITRHGYNGVTMRELAEKANVTPKTLYHQFGNKEKLLNIAVEERFRHTYQVINDQEMKRGIDKLFFIIDAVAASAKKNQAYAQALLPLTAKDSNDPFLSIRLNTYGAALVQIQRDGDFVDGVDTGILTHVIYRNVHPLYTSWYGGEKVKPEQFSKYNVSLVLSSITTGYTNQKIIKMMKLMQKELRPLDSAF
jgi:AcrR family transcriptional regulator